MGNTCTKENIVNQDQYQKDCYRQVYFIAFYYFFSDDPFNMQNKFLPLSSLTVMLFFFCYQHFEVTNAIYIVYIYIYIIKYI